MKYSLLILALVLISCGKNKTACTTCTTYHERKPNTQFASDWYVESESANTKCGDKDDIEAYSRRQDGIEETGFNTRDRTVCSEVK